MRCKELSRKYESVSYSESSYRESNNETMTARKEWRKDETFKLITMYEVNTILWNTKDLDYKNKEKKKQDPTANQHTFSMFSRRGTTKNSQFTESDVTRIKKN